MAAPIDRRLLSRATATRPFLVAVGVVGIVHAVLVLIQAWILSQAVARVFHTHSADGVLRDALWLTVIFGGRSVLVWANQWLAHRASAAVKSQLRRDVITARLRRPLDPGTPTAGLITLLTQGLDALDGYFAKYLPQLILAATVPLIIGGAILSQDLTSALIVIVTLPLIPIFMILIGWTTREQMARRWKVQQRLSNHFADLVAGLPTLQVFGRARAQVEGLRRTEDASRTETMKTLRISFLSALALEMLATLSVALVAVSIGFRVVFDSIDLATGLFIIILAPEAYLPVRQVGVHYHDSADGSAAAASAFAVIDAADAASGTLDAPDLANATITFDDVSLVYTDPLTGNEITGLANFSARINPGEVVALSGPSGGGKSSAVNLLMGFLTPTSGHIYIDEFDLADLDRDAVLSDIAWVGQNPGMLTGNVADNVALGAIGATEEELRSALDRVGGNELSLTKPIGDDGEGLSAGERRRVALARALVRIEAGAGLLVLDEPTAGLDQATEAEAIQAVRAAGVSALIVSHRPAVLAMADRVIVVNEPVAVVIGGDE